MASGHEVTDGWHSAANARAGSGKTGKQPTERRKGLYVARRIRARHYVGRQTCQVSAPDQLPGGRHELRFEFEPTGQPDFGRGKGSPGSVRLYVDGQLVAQDEFPVTTPVAFNPGGLTWTPSAPFGSMAVPLVVKPTILGSTITLCREQTAPRRKDPFASGVWCGRISQPRRHYRRETMAR